MSKLSYKQSYAQVWKFTTSKKAVGMSDTAIYKTLAARSTGTMRKQDFFRAMKPIREAQKNLRILDNSNMHPVTRVRIEKEFRTAARDQTSRGQASYVKSLSKKRRATYKKRGRKATVGDISGRLFKYHPHPTWEEFIEFTPSDPT